MKRKYEGITVLDSGDMAIDDNRIIRVSRCIHQGLEKIDFRIWIKYPKMEVQTPTKRGLIMEITKCETEFKPLLERVLAQRQAIT